MLECLAAIPPTASAVKIDGEEGGAVRVTLDCYLTGEQLEQLIALRGKELVITLRATN